MINTLNSDITGIELSGLSISEVRFGDILVWPDGTPPIPPTPTPVAYYFALVPSAVTVQGIETIITLIESGYTPEWSIVTIPSWVNYLGEDEGRISLVVQPNTDLRREGSFVLSYVSDSTGGTQTFSIDISQAGAPYRITYHSSEMLTPYQTLVPYILDHTFSDGYGVIYLDSSLTGLPSMSFYSSTAPLFTEMTLPNGFTSIGGMALENCYYLSSVTIPDSVTSIGYDAFLYCRNLTGVTLPSGLTTIGETAFGNCEALTGITIPATITTIGGMAFWSCNNLTQITVKATTPPTLEGTDVFPWAGGCPIYVPAGSVNAYKTAPGWSYYSNRITAIP